VQYFTFGENEIKDSDEYALYPPFLIVNVKVILIYGLSCINVNVKRQLTKIINLSAYHINAHMCTDIRVGKNFYTDLIKPTVLLSNL